MPFTANHLQRQAMSTLFKQYPHRHYFYSLLIVLICLLPTAQAFAQQPAIPIDGNPNTAIALLPFSDFLKDQQGNYTIEQLQSPVIADHFKAVGHQQYRIKKDSGVYWLRFSLHNTTLTAQRLWLSLDNARITAIELHAGLDAEQPVSYGGSHFIAPDRSTQQRFDLLPLKLHAGETRHYYLRLDSQAALDIAPEVLSEHSQIIHSRDLDIQLGIFMGVLLALCIYSINIYITLKNRIFLIFIGVLFTITFQIMANQGVLKLLLPTQHLLLDHSAIIGTALSILTQAFFIRYYLYLPQRAPVLDRIILAIGIVPAIALVLVPMPIKQAEHFVIIALAIATVIFIIVSFIRLHQGFNPARFPIAANLGFLLPVSWLDAIPESIQLPLSTANIYNLSTVIQMIILACGLASLIESLNRKLSREVTDRKNRELQLVHAQKIARYGDWSWEVDTQKLNVSNTVLDILPIDKLEYGNDVEQLLQRMNDQDRHRLQQALTEAATNRQGFNVEFQLQHDDGTTHYYLSQAEFQRDRNGEKTSSLIGTLHDITDSKLADMAYKENEQRWRELADSTFEAILIFQDNIIIDANQACDSILGYSPTQLIGTNGSCFISEEQLPMLLAKINNADNSAFELTLCNIKQEEITVEVRSKPGIFNQQHSSIVAIRDISERKQHEQQLRKLGYYDSLTGLANRTLFQQRLQRAIDKSERLEQKHALLFIDLDQFKNVNDSLGHDTGDKLLIEVGKRLLSRVRKVDTVARLGGDEFAILIEDVSAPYAAARVAEELLKVMSEDIQVDEYHLLVTPSIGIALYPSDGDNGGELLRKADTAMYHAKSLGRNNYQFYTEALNEKIIRRMDLESELRLAIERDELFLNFQPKVDLHTGNIVGAEALLRWRSEKHGLVSPADFICIAEETGMIWPIGELVLEHACRQALGWLEIYPSFGSIAVNISGIQFNHSSLVDTVAKVLEKTGIPPQHLELEITEGAIINNAEEAILVMKQLKNLGVKLSLDDFGTGYSSLNYLKRFPVDSLKIDRSFVAEIVFDKTSLMIADNIVKLAHDLQLNVVAEGVETTEQLNIIRKMGCDQLQGYIFSKPLTNTEMDNKLATHSNLYTNNPDTLSVENF
jgi:diguanylate cyclase (GGDEF)-like protein/PAS domain S-box-containing protein